MDKSVDKVDNPSRRQLKPLTGATLGVFAKQPVPGTVKTRLCPPLSPQEAADLYATTLQETVARLLTTPYQLVVCYAGTHRWFTRTFPNVRLLKQSGEDLGQRLASASTELFATGANPLLLVGSDSPDLPLERLEQALAILAEADVVTTPCHDGGYAMIGLRQPQPALFTDIPWSTAGVLQATRQRAQQLGLHYRETAAWDDLDDLAALQRLMHRSPESRTAAYVRRQLADYL